MSAPNRLIHIAILLAISLSACSEGSLLLPDVSEEASATVEAPPRGATISENEEIPLRILYPEGAGSPEADSMEIQILDANGAIVRRSVVDAAVLDETDSFSLDPGILDEGRYELIVLVFSDSDLITENRSQFFYTRAEIDLISVSAYPPSVYPGSSGFLQAYIETSAGADPYVRWRIGSRELAAGLVSEGLDELVFEAPASEGAHTISVDVYPFAPEARAGESGTGYEAGYDFDAELRRELEIYVSRTENPGQFDLGPPPSYFTLLHFRGDSRDSGIETGGTASQPVRAVPLGEPDLRVEQDVFGYFLDGDAGFELDSFALPVRNGALTPFSVNMRLLFQGDQRERTLFSTGTEDDGISMLVNANSSGFLAAELRLNGSMARSVSNIRADAASGPMQLSISVAPSDTETTIMWFADGILNSISSHPVGNSVDAGESASSSSAREEWEALPGTTLIGGRPSSGFEGFIGIIDEFGVYYRDEEQRPATDGEVFAKAMRSLYAASLAYAEGFEGLFLPEEIETTGAVTAEAGVLTIPPGGSVAFPAFVFELEDLIIEIGLGDEAPESDGAFLFSRSSEAAVPSGGSASQTSGDAASDGSTATGASERQAAGSPAAASAEDQDSGSLRSARRLFSVNTDYELSIGERSISLGSELPEVLLLRLQHSTEGLRLRIAGESYDLPLDGDGFRGVRLSASQLGESEISLRILSVLARRTNAQLTAGLTGGNEREEGEEPATE